MAKHFFDNKFLLTIKNEPSIYCTPIVVCYRKHSEFSRKNRGWNVEFRQSTSCLFFLKKGGTKRYFIKRTKWLLCLLLPICTDTSSWLGNFLRVQTLLSSRSNNSGKQPIRTYSCSTMRNQLTMLISNLWFIKPYSVVSRAWLIQSKSHNRTWFTVILLCYHFHLFVIWDDESVEVQHPRWHGWLL